MPTFERKIKDVVKSAESLNLKDFDCIIASNGAIGITLGKVNHKGHHYYIQPENEERLETILRIDEEATWFALTDKENEAYLASRRL